MRTPLKRLLFIFFIVIGHTVDSTQNCTKILPDSSNKIPVELGKEFTATCYLKEDSGFTTDDIEWMLADVTVSREFYKKINNSAVSVTVNISSDTQQILKCRAAKNTPSYVAPCMYGIYFEIGYPPSKPTNLTCVAVQDGSSISPNLTCSWNPGTRNPILPTTYTLYASSTNIRRNSSSSSSKPPTNLKVSLQTFPNHWDLEVWVTAVNALGLVESDHLKEDAEYFVKPNPPSNVNIIAEKKFPTSLLVNWTHPFHETIFRLKYNIRYCQADASVWKYEPQEYTGSYIESYRLQTLKPYTDYVVQVRCIHWNNLSYWSDWSSNVTRRTAEATPESPPDVWLVRGEENTVKLIWKDPVKANGKILGYNITVNYDLGPKWLTVDSKLSPKETQLQLKGDKTFIRMTAHNSAGISPPTILLIYRHDPSFPCRIEKVDYSVRGKELWVHWSTFPVSCGVHEFLLEWLPATGKEREWQRVPSNTNSTALKGDFRPFVRYHISIYPIFRYKTSDLRYVTPGSRSSIDAYLRQGPPLKGPSLDVTKTQKTSAHLQWEEIPVESQQGFLTNYTIFFKTGNIEKSIVVGPETLSYELSRLESDRQYVVHVMVSNTLGSANGSESSLYTKKYDQGEIELIVVFVCLGFLFFILFIMMFFLKKREVIKKHFWPQVPDPSHSTIATWSPDGPVRADSPKEATLPDVSVVEVDVFDGKSLCEEDKVILPLKKDKYFSEEHSSGIGGSSCMSSPRQSVSDSDEGDSGQTTASTVQYSSVVASGYKGQTPSLQAPIFARSESTQPLLDCEEHPENLLDNSSHPRNSYFQRSRGLEQLPSQDAEEHSCFSSAEEDEDTPTLTEDQPCPAPGYMPQRNGYRPQ